MRFDSTSIDRAAILRTIEQEGRPVYCPYCGQPVTRERAMEVDRAWKQHFDYCEARLRYIEARDAAIEEELGR